MTLLLYTLVLLTGLASCDLFKQDGVLVQPTGHARTPRGFWTIVIVIEPPTKPSVAEWTSNLHSTLLSYNNITSEDRMLWDSQLHQLDDPDIPDDLEMSVPRRMHTSRRRRGLLNAVGLFSKSLFGTATQEDVDLLKNAVAESRTNLANLFHNQEQLLTVYNKTRNLLKNSFINVHALQSITQRLSSNVEAMNNETTRLTHAVNYLVFARKMDVSLQRVADVLNIYRRQQNIFHQQKMQLERGWLTEEILPPYVLDTVLLQIRQNHMATLPLHWYYEHLSVQPLWEQSDQLSFKVTLPGLSTEEYLFYQFTYFWVNWGNDHLRKITGRDKIAINTATGHSFTPSDTLCIGASPLVCYPDKVELQSNCETNLISGMSDAGCQFQVVRRSNETLAVYRRAVDDSEVILVGYSPVNVITRCIGQSAVTNVISGPTIMHVEPNCSLETTNWRIHGVQTASRSINLRFRPYLTLPPLNISWPLTPPVSLLQTLNVTDRATFPWDDIPALIAPTFTDLDTTLWEQYQPYFIAAIAVALTCCVAVLIFYYCRIGGFNHCRRPRSESQTVVTARPDASTMATPTQAAVSYQPPFSHKAGTTLRMDAIAMHPASPYEQARALLDHALENWSDVTSFLKRRMGRM